MMKDKELKLFINRLNKGDPTLLIFLNPLSDNVDFAKVWTEKPKPNDIIKHGSHPYDIYFIKNNAGIYVAAVLDMIQDLHWFVLKTFRHQGHLTKGLQDTILFHLFQYRDEQRITINENTIGKSNFIASERVALKVGFTKTTSENEYLLKCDDYISGPVIKEKKSGISEERLQVLKKQLNYISRSLWVVQTEVEMKLDNLNFSHDLQELVYGIQKQISRLEDICWNNERY